jgi:hypothetical protein
MQCKCGNNLMIHPKILPDWLYCPQCGRVYTNKQITNNTKRRFDHDVKQYAKATNT